MYYETVSCEVLCHLLIFNFVNEISHSYCTVRMMMMMMMMTMILDHISHIHAVTVIPIPITIIATIVTVVVGRICTHLNMQVIYIASCNIYIIK